MIRRLAALSRGSLPKTVRPFLLRNYSIQDSSSEQFSSPNKQLEHDLYDRLRKLPLNQVLSNTELSPDVEKKLNEEFSKFVTEFGLESDLTQDILKYVMDITTTPESISRTKDAADGGLRGNISYPNVGKSSSESPYTAQELFVRRLFHAKKLHGMGANVRDVYEPHNDIFHPPSVRKTTIATLLAAGCHLGHVKALYRQSNQPYIYGIRDGIHIIDLDQTLVHLRRAAKVIEQISENGGIILYVGTLPGQERSVQVAAERSNGYYVHTRWIPGTISNSIELAQTWERQEVDMGDQPTGRKLTPQLKNTVIKPDMVVFLNPVETRYGLLECNDARIPSIGLIDTNSEPSLVTYPIPCNDDSLRATDLMVGVLSRAAQKGMKRRRQKFTNSKLEQEEQREQGKQGKQGNEEQKEAEGEIPRNTFNDRK